MDLNLFKNKEELKKFLDNLGTEYRYGCYEEKNSVSCHLLGDYFYSIDDDKKKAAVTYAKNCDENKYGLSCDAYGRLAFRGHGIDRDVCDYKLALEYFDKGCDFNEPRACYHGGRMHAARDPAISKVIPLNAEKAIEMLDKGCQSEKLADSCFEVHHMYLNGSNVNKDLQKAAAYAEKACNQNHVGGCYNLSRMYKLGDGVEQDKDKAEHYKAKYKKLSEGKNEKVKAKEPLGPDL